MLPIRSALASLLLLGSLTVFADKPKYVMAKAYHILPETTSEESGYFSLCEGLDGDMYVGTARYDHDAYLVEFDPRSEKQRIVLDTNRACGLTGTGYAAQAKLHTRNYVGPSGKIYVGSKQGEPAKKVDPLSYLGGYVMTYDPRTGETTNLGMPFAHQGVIDVVADEGRDKLYVVTCEDQHWMLGGLKGGPYRELGPTLTPYATTLVDSRGHAHVITKDFQLATYDPTTGEVNVRPIDLDGKLWTRPDDVCVPTWLLAPDQKHAYLVLLNDPTLLEIDITTDAARVRCLSHGRMVEGKHPDCRCGLSLAADGKIYALVRVDNDTGFGTGYLHHLARYDPTTDRHEDLGVLAVSNPDYFPFNQQPPHSHGFHTLPDGTLTPLHHHMALYVAHDGTIYATILYPFTLLRIDAYKPAAAKATPASDAMNRALRSCGRAETMLPEITRVAEAIAKRHIAGGLIGFPIISQSLAPELWGRSGGMVNIGFDRPWKKDRGDVEIQQDVGIAAYDRPPRPGDAALLAEFKSRGGYLVGIGSRAMPDLRDVVPLCDEWLDTGDVTGRGATLANAVMGWSLIAETVGAITRHGKMPPIWKGYAYPDGPEWGRRFYLKLQFDDDHPVAPQLAGSLGAAWLRQIRYALRRLSETQLPALATAGHTVAREMETGRNVVIAWQGHMPPNYIGQFGDPWAKAIECHPFLPSQLEDYRKRTADGALVISLGSAGLDPHEADLWAEKHQRVIHLCGDHPDLSWRRYGSLAEQIDLGFAFGDACVSLEGYPVRLFAPSGVLQLAAYDAIVSETEACH